MVQQNSSNVATFPDAATIGKFKQDASSYMSEVSTDIIGIEAQICAAIAFIKKADVGDATLSAYADAVLKVALDKCVVCREILKNGEKFCNGVDQ